MLANAGSSPGPFAEMAWPPRVRVSADQILERAIETTGCDNFGGDGFRDGLEQWIAAAQSPPDGFGSAEAFAQLCDQAVRLLANRLRVVDYATQHSAVSRQPIERPLFVLGLPRTGTTAVSYLLDQDPARRSLLLWEAYDTSPPAVTATLRTDPRALELLERQKMMIAQDPSRASVHWEWADGPTQCTELHGHDFKATTWDRAYPVPAYSSWLEDADLRSAYEYEKLVLQVLQSQAPGAWSLKMPAHAMFIDSLLAVFPDARLVWAHRDPYRATASVLSAKSRGWSERWGRPALPIMLGYYPRQLGKHLTRMMRARERIGDERIFDLHYSAFLRDPLAVMRELYAWAGDELTAEVEAAMAAWLRDNPQGKYGKYSYGLSDLGVDRQVLTPYFEEYLDTYTVAPEPEK